jgi:hypothetical protein
METQRSADIPVCGFTGLSSPVFQGTGGWKTARTRRLESLRYDDEPSGVSGQTLINPKTQSNAERKLP